MHARVVKSSLSGLLVPAILFAGAAASSAQAQAPWASFVNESSTRLVASPSLLVNDNIEKDFGWGDFNHDGWVDLAVGRKFPGSIQGGFRNILFMNEGGVLVDRTNEYASTSDVAGYHGFLDPTNDRDMYAVDINGDGWLDLVTATTMSDGLIDIIGQPRAYINLGNDAQGHWQGFRHERDRIPHLFPPSGNATANPRFCDLTAGDFNNDGFMDLFYVDYDTPETSGTQTMDLNGDGDTNDPGETQQSPGETAANDFNNKLLFNWGNTPGGPGPGYFFDTTTTVATSAQLNSAFGNASTSGDFTGDGKDDIVRVSTLGGDGVGVLTRKASGAGFLGIKLAYTGAPYHVEKADLNNDGKLDLIVADDSQDRYLINTGNDATGQPNFTSFVIAQSASEFGNTIKTCDWDKDGKVDAVIVDIDADLPSFCPTTGRRTHIYRNTYSGSTSNILVESNASFSKPFSDTQLQAWFDVAPIDIDNDGWPDMVVGRCSGIEVYMNRKVFCTYAYPSGRPSVVTPDVGASFPLTIAPTGGVILDGTVKLNYSVNGGPWQQTVLSGSGSYTASFPALQCGDTIDYSFEAALDTGGPYRDPSNAPYAYYTMTAGETSVTPLNVGFETGLEGFTVENFGMTVGSKGWEQATPVATTLNSKPWAPGTAGAGTKALVTWNGVAGGAATASDLDGGPTIATSPVVDLSAVPHPILSYKRWFANDDTLSSEGDALVVQVTNDGSNWVTLETVNTHGENLWRSVSFDLADILPLTATMQVRFSIADAPDNSVTEAAIDAVVITGGSCPVSTPCPSDLDHSGGVDGADLAVLLGGWGGAAGDLNGDGTTDGADLAVLLGAWGACP